VPPIGVEHALQASELRGLFGALLLEVIALQAGRHARLASVETQPGFAGNWFEFHPDETVAMHRAA
jgi:hypothetical protein